MSELEILSEDARWIRTGILEQHDAFTINPCVSMFADYVVASRLAFEKGFSMF